jgi:hypothetical protein
MTAVDLSHYVTRSASAARISTSRSRASTAPPAPRHRGRACRLPIVAARVNYTLRRVAIDGAKAPSRPAALVAALGRLGYKLPFHGRRRRDPLRTPN